jgi:hypothetical protein
VCTPRSEFVNLVLHFLDCIAVRNNPSRCQPCPPSHRLERDNESNFFLFEDSNYLFSSSCIRLSSVSLFHSIASCQGLNGHAHHEDQRPSLWVYFIFRQPSAAAPIVDPSRPSPEAMDPEASKSTRTHPSCSLFRSSDVGMW